MIWTLQGTSFPKPTKVNCHGLHVTSVSKIKLTLSYTITLMQFDITSHNKITCVVPINCPTKNHRSGGQVVGFVNRNVFIPNKT